MNMLTILLGLSTLQGTLVEKWIGPAFMIVVAGIAIKFIISRQFRELAGFLGIAAVVALLVFNGDGLFGKAGIFTKIANTFSKQLDGGEAIAPGGVIQILKNFIR